ncbi:hypothetical protein Rrhod_1761 [Rhodococcus rhodnii LMG 5362]|uniref:Uncharacterized protein n=1 Tax=Rhodococcus rhodnii LMG 5362 TaxID=1273125 RepID=R7WNH1_9NOCA|nr:hypothetical protein Rrhod_1761 [Rhodococcus rhodnii LMG 5362]
MSKLHGPREHYWTHRFMSVCVAPSSPLDVVVVPLQLRGVLR